MLYGGATILEGIAVLLYVSGFSPWTIGLTAVVGFALLLVIDWFAEQRTSTDGHTYQG